MRRSLVILAVAGTLLAQRSPLDRAWDLAGKRQPEKAIGVLEELIRKEPRNGAARLLLGSLLASTGNSPQAITQLKEAVRLLPNSAEAHNTLGEAFRALEDAQQARGEFEKAVQLNPKLAQAQLNLGMTLGEAGELSAAAVHLDEAIRIMGQTEDAAVAHYLRAKVYTEEGEKEKAAAELNLAVKLKPDQVGAWSDLGLARKTLGDDAGALAAFERAASLDPGSAAFQARLGAEYLHRKQPQQAVIHLQKAIQLDPTDQTALFNLQRALREGGQGAEAEVIAGKLAEILRNKDQTLQNGLNATRLNNEGVKLQDSGDLRGALEKYRAAHELKPEDNRILFKLAVAHLRLGHWKEGLAELHECLTREPTNPTVKAVWNDALRQAPPGSWVEDTRTHVPAADQCHP